MNIVEAVNSTTSNELVSIDKYERTVNEIERVAVASTYSLLAVNETTGNERPSSSKAG